MLAHISTLRPIVIRDGERWRGVVTRNGSWIYTSSSYLTKLDAHLVAKRWLQANKHNHA